MKEELRILMIEDIAADAGLIERSLQQNGIIFTSMRVETREGFLNALADFAPDVVLCDHGLPMFNSIEALQLCQESAYRGPFILVTGTVSEEFAVTCLKQGADDYILKSNLSRLASAITNALNQRKAREEKALAEEKLRAQNAALEKANEELLKSNVELDSFVYSVSHNLRAPLMSVVGLINLTKIEIPPGGEHFMSYLEMMESSINRLDDTLKEILEYSHNARDEITIEPVDIEAITHQTLKKLSFLPAASKITLTTSVDKSNSFYSDRYRITVLINCLLTNSIKFSDPEKPECKISVDCKSNGTMSLTIADNGIGIAGVQLPKVFNMFYRASEQSDGAGLGLYIAKEIVNKLRGSISIASEPSQGTTVYIRIPNETVFTNDTD